MSVWVGLLGSLQSGCSLIGLAVDTSQPPDTLAVDTADKQLEGKLLHVTLHDGYRIVGECRFAGSLPGTRTEPGGQGNQLVTAGRQPTSGGSADVAAEPADTRPSPMRAGVQTPIVIVPYLAGSTFVRLPSSSPIGVGGRDSLWVSRSPDPTGESITGKPPEESPPPERGLLIRNGQVSVWVPLDKIARAREVRYSYQWFNRGAIVDMAGLVVALVLLL